MQLETKSPQEKIIDIDRLKELRMRVQGERELETKIKHERFIEREISRVKKAITNLPKKLEKAARKGQTNCEVLLYDAPKGQIRLDPVTKEELMQHPAYSELIRYLEMQGLTNVHTRERYEGIIGIYVALL